MPHIEVREVVKEYPGVRALGGVSLDFAPGEVHGVIGENGAGKSTLMKILAGVERATSGSVLVGGAECDFRGVQDSMRAGVAMIHQELNLVDDLSVAGNLFLGREGSGYASRQMNPTPSPPLEGEGWSGADNQLRRTPVEQAVDPGFRRDDNEVTLPEQLAEGPLLDSSVAHKRLAWFGTFLINKKVQMQEAEKWLEQVGADFGADRMVGSLSLAEKQLVEIAKAVSTGAEVLIMDEPTAVLSVREKFALFALVAKLKGEGKTVILISHLLGELIENCDRISVLRDGEYVGTVVAGEVDERSLAGMMVGRELGDMYPVIPGSESEVVFRVRFGERNSFDSNRGGDELSVGPVPAFAGMTRRDDDIKGSTDFPQQESTNAGDKDWAVDSVPTSAGMTRRDDGVETYMLDIHAGEVLGFAGLIGSGRTELWESILGLRREQLGSGSFEGGASQSRLVDWNYAGVVYVSEDRKGAGLHLDFSVENNVALPWLSRFGRIVTNRSAVRGAAENWREKLSIKVPDVGDKVGSLSGGNQQKVSLAKWLEGDPKLIVLDEPTRGVDVGSKAQIYEIIAGLAAEGKAVVVISSEMQELIGLCHRVVVMRGGVPVGILDREELSEERIVELAAGVMA